MENIIKKDGCTVIKPNMGNLTHHPGVTTTPDLLYHVVSRLRDHVEDVVVGESDGMRYSCDEAFALTGFRDAVESAGGRIVNFSKDEQVEVDVNGLHWNKILLPKTIIEADSFISMPVIKTHEATLITCGLKNQFGCLANRHRILYHRYLHEVLVDINLAIQPDLVITDGIICMEGNGPIHGPLKELGIILASNNVLANDLVVSEIMKVDYNNVVHLKNAIIANLGPNVLEDIDIRGVSLSNFKNINFNPVKLDLVARAMISVSSNPLLTRILLLSPLFNF